MTIALSAIFLLQFGNFLKTTHDKFRKDNHEN
jgi:hypothetical protein